MGKLGFGKTVVVTSEQKNLLSVLYINYNTTSADTEFYLIFAYGFGADILLGKAH